MYITKFGGNLKEACKAVMWWINYYHMETEYNTFAKAHPKVPIAVLLNNFYVEHEDERNAMAQF